MGGDAKADFAARDDRFADGSRQTIDGAFGLSIGKLQRNRARPAAAGQTLADWRELGDIVENFVGAADGEGGGAVELPGADGEQALHAAAGQGAGGSDIDGFGGEGDDFAFDERLHDAVDRVARVAGGSEVENLRRHANKPIPAAKEDQKRREQMMRRGDERARGIELRSIFVQGGKMVKCGRALI